MKCVNLDFRCQFLENGSDFGSVKQKTKTITVHTEVWEIKTNESFPVWAAQDLSEIQIKSTSECELLSLPLLTKSSTTNDKKVHIQKYKIGL